MRHTASSSRNNSADILLIIDDEGKGGSTLAHGRIVAALADMSFRRIH